MKVKDLIAELQECNPEDNVALPIELPYATLGGSPRVDVDAVWRGFDWDSGTVFLYPPDKQALTLLSKEEYHKLVEYKQLASSALGRKTMQGLSDVFVRKAFVVDLLTKLSDVEFDTETIRKIKEEIL